MKLTTLAIVLTFIPVPLFAQASAITGTVTDEFGNPLPNAAIQATNVATQIYYQATSSATGVYTIGRLPAGRYFLLVDAKVGRYTRDGITVGSGETVRIDARIRVDITLGTLG